jgi:hypothetical protein
MVTVVIWVAMRVVVRMEVWKDTALVVDVMVEVGATAVLVITVVALPHSEVEVRKQAGRNQSPGFRAFRGIDLQQSLARECLFSRPRPARQVAGWYGTVVVLDSILYKV